MLLKVKCFQYFQNIHVVVMTWLFVGSLHTGWSVCCVIKMCYILTWPKQHDNCNSKWHRFFCITFKFLHNMLCWVTWNSATKNLTKGYYPRENAFRCKICFRGSLTSRCHNMISLDDKNVPIAILIFRGQLLQNLLMSRCINSIKVEQSALSNMGRAQFEVQSSNVDIVTPLSNSL